MKALLTRFRTDRRGAATVEFALWAVAFFMVATVALDFGDLFIKRSRVNDAVSAAAVQSFQNRDTVTYTSLQAYIRALADDPAVTVSAVCNGNSATACTNTGRTCACLKTDGTYVAAASCGAACGSGSTTNSTAGYYLTISAQRNYSPMVLPRGQVSGSEVRETATVRLQ